MQGVKDCETAQVALGLLIKYLLWTRRYVTDQCNSYRPPYMYTSDNLTNFTRSCQPRSWCEDFYTDIESRLYHKHGQVQHWLNTPGIVQPAPPTGTHGEWSIKHGIGILPPLVGRPSASVEVESNPQNSDQHSITLVALNCVRNERIWSQDICQPRPSSFWHHTGIRLLWWSSSRTIENYDYVSTTDNSIS